MVDFKYLYKGICGIANAHPLGTMAGHLGAAVATGYFIGEDLSDLPAEVYQGIERELERVIAGEESIWFDVKKTGTQPTDLFRPFKEQSPTPIAVNSIAKALQKNVGKLKQSGHNVIFASIAIRALRGHPEYATPPVIGGIRKLIQRFDNVSPGRGFYGGDRGWQNGNEVKLTQENTFAEYNSIKQMVEITIGELITHAATKKQGFGGLWHLINHAAGITELERLGYSEIANQALPAHHQHLQLWRTLPDVEEELGPVLKSQHSPLVSEYWNEKLNRDGAQLTHRIKTLFGYYTLRRLVKDVAKQKQADDAFLNLMN